MDSHSNSSTKEEKQSSKVLSELLFKSHRIIESLQDDILFEIILKLSVEDIRNGASLVCRKWYDMIYTRSFIYTHLHRSTTGLLIHNISLTNDIKFKNPTFVSMHQGRIELSKFIYNFSGGILFTCNGLMLESDISIDNPAARIVNPATNQSFTLPGLPHLCRQASSFAFSLAYASASMEYKVVKECGCRDGKSRVRCAILTVGAGNIWRHLHTEHLSSSETEMFRRCDQIMSDGFIHWTGDRGDCVLSLNVETETIRQFAIPQGYGIRLKYFLSMGRYLSFVVGGGESMWEVWVMISETGEWTKMCNVELGTENCRPVGWLKEKEVLVFHFAGESGWSWFCIAYNIHTRRIDSFNLDSVGKFNLYQPHTPSLVFLTTSYNGIRC